MTVTVTIGVAQYWPGMDIDQCLQCADDAMYLGKRAGRNQAQSKRP
jgi:PleD family two-component response regulator